MRSHLPVLVLLLAAGCFANEPLPRPIPPPGIPVPDDVRAELTEGATALAKAIAQLAGNSNSAGVLRELPNIEIFHKAVDWALRYNEFFDPKQFEIARDQLAQGHARLEHLRKSETPWNAATGLVVRAYRSEIDGSVQPYGLVIPADWKPDDGKAWPLHFWCHGRGEKLTELAFIAERQRDPGEFTPPGAIVCHLYGRYCNANKFAGERDLFEALADIRNHYGIDEARLVIRGFSMGGAAAWQFATHHAGMWAAAAPGAGFAETAEFFKVFAPGKLPPPWWEQVLWRWYDSTTMAANLANVPTIAYSGETDGQKQAADIMVRYAKAEGVEFPHIIGPQTAHKYHPDSKPQIDEFVTSATKDGRKDFPTQVKLTTYSLIYPRVDWVTITGMEKQWERADIAAERGDTGKVQVTTKNVNEFALTPPSDAPLGDVIILDGTEVPRPKAVFPISAGERELRGIGFGRVEDLRPIFAFAKTGPRWSGLEAAEINARPPSLHKDARLCGPIDHAFMSRFVFVRPTGQPLNPEVGAWAKAEMEHAIASWRKVFRGAPLVKDDTALTADDIQGANLILWGDPSSNRLFDRMLTLSVRETGHPGDPLGVPFTWTHEALHFRGQKYDAAHHVLALIFPNPLNPKKYIVLNSGPTFREEALLNNSDQTPKLPDWAIIDLHTPPGPKWPGEVVDAGFFDEQWR